MSSIVETVAKINEYIASQFHLEMCFYEYKKYSLMVVASEDIIYYHTLEISFDDVDIISGKVDWQMNTKEVSFGILSDEELFQFNVTRHVVKGYSVFYFKDEDGLYTYVVAKGVSMRLNTVKY